MNRSESCYDQSSRKRMVTLHTPSKKGVPIVKRMSVKKTDGTEEVLSRREFKEKRKDLKAWRRKNKVKLA